MIESLFYKFVRKYNVNIDSKYTLNDIIVIISNSDDVKTVRNANISELVEEVESVCKEMCKNEIESNKEMMKELEILVKNKELFPPDLFYKK